MSSDLNIGKVGSKIFRLPAELQTLTTAILGIRGSGKTTTAVVLVEELLQTGAQVVIVDPLDVWWGLKSSKDGRAAGFPVVVLGGEHGDLPLAARDGTTVADFVVDQRAPLVMSLRHLRKHEQRDVVTAFCEQLYHRKGELKNRVPLLVVIDEASSFCPQHVDGKTARMVGAVEDLVRRGRSSGIGLIAIDQRPASINKDVLTQLELLVSHQVTSPQDRKALQLWIEAHDSAGHGKEFLESLASLKTGEAWFWSPGWDVFDRVLVRDRTTFDSSATPKAGRQPAAPKKLAELDLDALKVKLAATVEEAKANDPKELKRQVAELRAQIAKQTAGPTPDQVREQLAGEISKREEAWKASAEASLRQGLTALVNDVTRILADVGRDLDVIERLDESLASLVAMKERRVAVSAQLREWRAGCGTLTVSAPVMQSGAKRCEVVRRIIPGNIPSQPARPQPFASKPVSNVPAVLPDGVTLNRACERRVLAALATKRGPATLQYLATRAGYARNGGGFNGALSKLRTLGLITRGDPCELTEAGRAATADVEPLPTGQALIDYWLGQMSRAAEREVLRVAVEVYPESIDKAAAAVLAGYEANGGGFNGAVSKLRTLGLIDARWPLRASDELFE